MEVLRIAASLFAIVALGLVIVSASVLTYVVALKWWHYYGHRWFHSARHP